MVFKMAFQMYCICTVYMVKCTVYMVKCTVYMVKSHSNRNLHRYGTASSESGPYLTKADQKHKIFLLNIS